MKKKKILMLASVLFIGQLVLSSCGTSSKTNSVTATDFVDTLVKTNGLVLDSGEYSYVDGKDLEYDGKTFTYGLHCYVDDSFGYVFRSFTKQKVTSGELSGTLTTYVDFIWGRYESSLFKGYGDCIVGATENYFGLDFFGLVFNDDGTISNTCYYKYNTSSLNSLFKDLDPINNLWTGIMANVSRTSYLTNYYCGVNLW